TPLMIAAMHRNQIQKSVQVCWML
ncbi:hypothetical protein M8C21_030171, partial [Ambrosia artemisiifolia]